MKELLVRPEAEADIDGIWEYTVETWGIEQANRYAREVWDRIQDLTAGSVVSRAVDEVKPGLRRVAVGRHVVFFRETERAVGVVRVLHGRMDVGRV